MVRNSQTARKAGQPRDEPNTRWFQRQYVDHEGNLVTLGKIIIYEEEDFTHPDDHRANFPLQIYSSIPIEDSDFPKLYRYFVDEDETNKTPKLEIYSYRPRNALECVEHQRCEITYRKSLYAEAAERDPEISPTETTPPLIPRTWESYRDPESAGLCIFLTSDCFRHKYAEDRSVPQMITFNRRFPNEPEIPIADRIGYMGEYVGQEVFPEVREVQVVAMSDERWMVADGISSLIFNIWGNCKQNFDYGIGKDEGQPMPSDSGSIVLNLEQAMQSLSINTDEICVTQGHEASALAVSNTTEQLAEYDLQYLVYVPFLAGIADPSNLLETTGRLFTTSIVANLPSPRTVFFEFRVPSLPSVSSILPVHPDSIQTPELEIGALQVMDASLTPKLRERVAPLRYQDIFMGKEWKPDPAKLFAVVLDRPSFLTEPGVLLLDVKSDYPPVLESGLNVWLGVRRSAGMAEVTRRLAMLAVEEHWAGATETQRILSQEEFDAVRATLPETDHRLL